MLTNESETPTTRGFQMNELAKVERAAKKAKQVVTDFPMSEDPIAELRLLVNQHRAVQIAKVGAMHRSSDKKVKATGEIFKCRLPADLQAEYVAFVDSHKRHAKDLERKMTKALKKVPIYTHLLSKVFGVGTVMSAYLVASVNIRIADKPSRLKRFCGLAVFNGRLERRTAGVKNAYNADIRTKLFTAFDSMWKNAAKKSAARPNGTTCKYLDVWRNAKHRELNSERVDIAANKWRDIDGNWRPGAAGHSHSKGWHKAADVLIDDIYIVWRAIEGLPAWPTYYEAKLGYHHGGVDLKTLAPVLRTVEEALAVVGDVGPRPAAEPIEDAELFDSSVAEDIEAEASAAE